MMRMLGRCRTAETFAIALAAALVLAGCDDDNDDEFFGDPPDAPENLTTFTGDGEVILVWDPSDDDVESYNVYAFIESTDDFELIGITTSLAFVDDDVVNGETFLYRVTAVDFDGDESDFSNEAFDTPRPAALNVLLESVLVDPGEAGFDLTTGTVVSAGSPEATFRLDEFNGAPQIVPLNGAEVQNIGFVDRLACRGEPGCTELNFAPESGYFPEAQQAFVGDAFVFRIPDGGDRFFGAVRISHLAPGLAVLDWTFQPDEGNRELLVRPAP